MIEHVILVNEMDEAVGTSEKIQAHLQGRLHRAFSIFIFDLQNRLLLQRRADTKYHSGNLWSNSCCSHPRPGEATEVAAHRRLQEEMGFDCEIREVFNFVYCVELDNDLFEHEYTHTFVGVFDGEPNPSALEVAEWKWVQPAFLTSDIAINPGSYTYWFKELWPRILAHGATNQAT